jgi:hypothetical protein
MPQEDKFAADCRSDSSSSDTEVDEFGEDSARKTAQISTGVLHTGGAPSNIHMQNNSDVQIGSRLHYNAPVTINQYVSVLGNSDVTQNSVLHEAVKVPIGGFDISENVSQGKLTKAAVVCHLAESGGDQNGRRTRSVHSLSQDIGSGRGPVTSYALVHTNTNKQTP